MDPLGPADKEIEDILTCAATRLPTLGTSRVPSLPDSLPPPPLDSLPASLPPSPPQSAPSTPPSSPPPETPTSALLAPVELPTQWTPTAEVVAPRPKRFCPPREIEQSQLVCDEPALEPEHPPGNSSTVALPRSQLRDDLQIAPDALAPSATSIFLDQWLLIPSEYTPELSLNCRGRIYLPLLNSNTTGPLGSRFEDRQYGPVTLVDEGRHVLEVSGCQLTLGEIDPRYAKWRAQRGLSGGVLYTDGMPTDIYAMPLQPRGNREPLASLPVGEPLPDFPPSPPGEDVETDNGWTPDVDAPMTPSLESATPVSAAPAPEPVPHLPEVSATEVEPPEAQLSAAQSSTTFSPWVYPYQIDEPRSLQELALQHVLVHPPADMTEFVRTPTEGRPSPPRPRKPNPLRNDDCWFRFVLNHNDKTIGKEYFRLIGMCRDHSLIAGLIPVTQLERLTVACGVGKDLTMAEQAALTLTLEAHARPMRFETWDQAIVHYEGLGLERAVLVQWVQFLEPLRIATHQLFDDAHSDPEKLKEAPFWWRRQQKEGQVIYGHLDTWGRHMQRIVLGSAPGAMPKPRIDVPVDSYLDGDSKLYVFDSRLREHATSADPYPGWQRSEGFGRTSPLPDLYVKCTTCGQFTPYTEGMKACGFCAATIARGELVTQTTWQLREEQHWREGGFRSITDLFEGPSRPTEPALESDRKATQEAAQRTTKCWTGSPLARTAADGPPSVPPSPPPSAPQSEYEEDPYSEGEEGEEGDGYSSHPSEPEQGGEREEEPELNEAEVDEGHPGAAGHPQPLSTEPLRRHLLVLEALRRIWVARSFDKWRRAAAEAKVRASENRSRRYSAVPHAYQASLPPEIGEGQPASAEGAPPSPAASEAAADSRANVSGVGADSPAYQIFDTPQVQQVQFNREMQRFQEAMLNSNAQLLAKQAQQQAESNQRMLQQFTQRLMSDMERATQQTPRQTEATTEVGPSPDPMKVLTETGASPSPTTAPVGPMAGRAEVNPTPKTRHEEAGASRSLDPKAPPPESPVGQRSDGPPESVRWRCGSRCVWLPPGKDDPLYGLPAVVEDVHHDELGRYFVVRLHDGSIKNTLATRLRSVPGSPPEGTETPIGSSLTASGDPTYPASAGPPPPPPPPPPGPPHEPGSPTSDRGGSRPTGGGAPSGAPLGNVPPVPPTAGRYPLAANDDNGAPRSYYTAGKCRAAMDEHTVDPPPSHHQNSLEAIEYKTQLTQSVRPTPAVPARLRGGAGRYYGRDDRAVLDDDDIMMLFELKNHQIIDRLSASTQLDWVQPVLEANIDNTGMQMRSRAFWKPEVLSAWYIRAYDPKNKNNLELVNKMSFPNALRSDRPEEVAQGWQHFRPGFVATLRNCFRQGCHWEHILQQLVGFLNGQGGTRSPRILSATREALADPAFLNDDMTRGGGFSLLGADVFIYRLDLSFVAKKGQDLHRLEWSRATCRLQGEDMAALRKRLGDLYFKYCGVLAKDVHMEEHHLDNFNERMLQCLANDPSDRERGEIDANLYEELVEKMTAKVLKGTKTRDYLSPDVIVEKADPLRKARHAALERERQDRKTSSSRRNREEKETPRRSSAPNSRPPNSRPYRPAQQTQQDVAPVYPIVPYEQPAQVASVDTGPQHQSRGQQLQQRFQKSKPPGPGTRPPTAQEGGPNQYGREPPPQGYQKQSDSNVDWGRNVDPPSGSKGHPEGKDWSNGDWHTTYISYNKALHLANRSNELRSALARFMPLDKTMRAPRADLPSPKPEPPGEKPADWKKWPAGSCAFCAFRPTHIPNAPQWRLGHGRGDHPPNTCRAAKRWLAEGGDPETQNFARELQGCLYVRRNSTSRTGPRAPGNQ